MSGQFAPARQWLEKAAAESTHPEVFVQFGNLALAEHRWTDAWAQFCAAEVAQTPSNWTDRHHDMLKIACSSGKATIAELRGDWSAAQEALQACVELQPNNATVRDRWATALLRSGREDRALEQFDMSYRLDKNRNHPEVSMGVVSAQQGNFNSADRWFSKALSLHADDGRIHYEFAVALLIQDRTAEANMHATKAEELGLRSHSLTMLRGLIARQEKRYDEAANLFNGILKTNPDAAEAGIQLALVLAENADEKKRDIALKTVEENAQRRPDSARAQAVHGWVLYRLGRYDDAERMVRSAAEMRLLDAEETYFVGVVLSHQGELEEARRIAEQLRTLAARPEVFVLRPDALQWISTTLK